MPLILGGQTATALYFGGTSGVDWLINNQSGGLSSTLFNFDFTNRSNLFTDASGTVAVSADGQGVRVAKGTGLYGQLADDLGYAGQGQPVSTTRGGLQGLTFGGTSALSIQSPEFLTAVGALDFNWELSTALYVDSLAASSFFFSLGNTASNTLNYWTFELTTTGAVRSIQVGDVTGTTTRSTAGGVVSAGNEYLITFTMHDGLLDISVDGDVINSDLVLSTQARTFNRATIGIRGRTTMGNPFLGDIFGIEAVAL